MFLLMSMQNLFVFTCSLSLTRPSAASGLLNLQLFEVVCSVENGRFDSVRVYVMMVM